MLLKSVALFAVSLLLLNPASAIPAPDCSTTGCLPHPRLGVHQFARPVHAAPTKKHKTTTKKSKAKSTPTPNVCRQYTDHFTSGVRIKSEDNYNGNPKSADWVDLSGDSKTLHLTTGGGLEMRVLSPGKVTTKNGANNKVGQGATINSTYLLNYGAVEARMKVSPVPGIVTAFITMSDQGDEVDWEWVGKADKSAQSNYYYNGIPDYSHGKVHPVTPKGKISPIIDDTKEWAVFRLELQPDYIRWLINGNIVRTVFKNQTAQGKPPVYHFPSRKTRVQLGIWDSSFDAGTAAWANGPVDWNHLGKYVSAYVDYVKIECDPRYNKVIS